MKKMIKQIITLFLHPIAATYFYLHGCKGLIINARMDINSLRDVKIGRDVHIGKDSRFVCVHEYAGKKYIPSIIIGNNVNITNRFTVLSAAPVNINDNCLIASDVLITSENHGLDLELSDSYVATPLDAKDVNIGAGCFVGEKVTILPGVNLGERCVVAANSVVSKSFPAYSMVAGMPAQLIKKYDFDTHCWKRVSN